MTDIIDSHIETIRNYSDIMDKAVDLPRAVFERRYGLYIHDDGTVYDTISQLQFRSMVGWSGYCIRQAIKGLERENQECNKAA